MRKTTLAALLVTAALAFPGCLGLGGRHAPEIRRHSIDLPEVVGAPGVEPIFGPVIVRQFTARGRYEPRVLVIEGAGRVDYLEFDRWVEDPSQAVTTVVRESMASSGRFAAVAAATSEMRTDLVVDGAVLACDVIRRPGQPWRARLVVRLEATERGSGEMVASDAYAAERDLPGEGVEGLGAAMGECVVEIMERAMQDWEVQHVASAAARDAAD